MPRRTTARRYDADDQLHSIAERATEDWGLGRGDETRMRCNECDFWFAFLFDTRAKGHYVCVNCLRNFNKRGDWKSWSV